MLRYEPPANRTPRHLLQLGNCSVFALVRPDAFKSVSSCQLSPGQAAHPACPLRHLVSGSPLPSVLAVPALRSLPGECEQLSLPKHFNMYQVQMQVYTGCADVAPMQEEGCYWISPAFLSSGLLGNLIKYFAT